MTPLRSIRLVPNDSDFLDSRFNNGDLYYDAEQKTLVLFDGLVKGGIPLLRADLTNAKSGLGVAVAQNPPQNSRSGSLWFNTNTGVLYVYVDDGDSNQWVQPAMPQFGQAGGGGGSSGATALTQLTDVSVVGSPSVGQVLKWNGAFWTNSADLQGTSGGADTTLTPKVTYVVTIVSPQAPDIGNKYRINGEYKPSLILQRGYTYVFDQSDDTNVYFPNANGTTPNPHNLNFSADQLNGERDGGTAFTTNVVYKLDNVVVTRAVYNGTAFNGATNRSVEITIGNNFPTTMYYWCYNHRNMGSNIHFVNPRLISLSDVAVSGPTNGEVLKYDGTQWVNAPDLSGSSASDSFRTISIAGQANVVADSPTDTLTLVAGSNITLTSNSTADTITIAATVPAQTTYTFNTQPAAGGVNLRLAGSDNTTQNVLFEEGANVSLTRVDANTISISASLSGAGVATSFSTIAVSGQPNVIADSSADTLTLVAGTNISLVTDGATDTITINNTQTVTQQNTFANIIVQAQPTVTADIPADNLTFVGAGGITITTNATTDTITFTGPTIPIIPATLDDLTDVQISVTPSDGQVLKYNGALAQWVPGTDNAGAGGAASNSFETIAVAGQTSVVADATTDTLTLVGAGGITITTNATTDTITLTGTPGASTLNDLTDVEIGGVGNNLSLGQILSYDGVSWKNYPTYTLDRIVLSAIASYDVVNNSLLSYRFTNFTGTTDNPTLYFKAGDTIAFNLNTLQGTHPFAILDQAGANYNTGLVHISRDGIVSTGSSAQAKISGTLYWQIPRDTVGRYQYICTLHPAMVGNIFIEPANEIDTSGSLTIDCRTARAFYINTSNTPTTVTITNVIPGVETKLYISTTLSGVPTSIVFQGGTNATQVPTTTQTLQIPAQTTRHFSIMGTGGVGNNSFVVG
jgi:plastocyanin